jgi:formate dehydrogenase assembly factor FdhD
MSRPTALALDLAKRLGMTLTSVRDDGLYVYTGKERITWKKQ